MKCLQVLGVAVAKALHLTRPETHGGGFAVPSFRSPSSTCHVFVADVSGKSLHPHLHLRRAEPRSSARSSGGHRLRRSSGVSVRGAAARCCRCSSDHSDSVSSRMGTSGTSSSRSSVLRRNRRIFIATLTAIRRSQPMKAAGSLNSPRCRKARR
jgi:hypothetical protein